MQPESLIQTLRRCFAAAIGEIAGRPAGGETDPQIRPAGDSKFGDYQCNAAMALARELKSKPRELAERIKAAVDPILADLAEPLEIAGPGFLNIRLKREALQARLEQVPPPPADTHEDRLGISRADRPGRVVIDYSSPNIAKQMHVGHLRGTILGDCLVRTLGFVGHEVIRQNHLGDWGTQFGKLIAFYADRPVPSGDDSDAVLDAIEADYRAANKRFDEDPAFAAAARAAVGRLQAGDPAAREIWQKLYRESQRAFEEVYARLGALLTDEDIRGESFYNDLLAETVAELRRRFPPRDRSAETGPTMEVREDAGALCLFLYRAGGEPAFRNPEGGEYPMIIQKSDGAYLYASTDLAALRFRTQELRADRIIYVVGNEQSQHLQMLFMAGRIAGWAGPDVRLEHAGHGLILGETGKKLTGRHGGNIHLRELLDEAVEKARAVVEEISARRAVDTDVPLSEEEKSQIAARVGVAAIKYVDLSHDRNTDYRFTWSKLLAMDGNTAPYLLYAYARIRSIYRKAVARFGLDERAAAEAVIELSEPAERALALSLLRAPEAIDKVAADLTPHVLCAYLYDLSGEFNRFYEACPVLAAEQERTRRSRLRLCDLTARTLRVGLRLLGIETIERM